MYELARLQFVNVFLCLTLILLYRLCGSQRGGWSAMASKDGSKVTTQGYHAYRKAWCHNGFDVLVLSCV